MTEKRLFIKAKHPTLKHVITEWPEGVERGDGTHNWRETVEAAVVMRNSEIGLGKLQFAAACHTRECSNLAVHERYQFSKYHVGSRHDSGDELRELYSGDTKQKESEFIWSKIRDLVTASMNGTIFNKIVEELKSARRDPIEIAPTKTVEIFGKENGLTEDETGGVLQHLLRGGDLTRYGLHNAVTRMSADVESYERASELEVLGGKIIEMKPNQWGMFAKAA